MLITSLKKIVEKIEHSSSPEAMETKIIAIDGCGGSGKTTFSTKLSKYLGKCPVIHTDDFASWDNPLNWHQRMVSQVLCPLKENKLAIFQRYDWNTKKLENWITVEPQKFVIVEGVSSSRKEFRPFLTFSIFLQTAREIRLERGLNRDGQEAQTQWLLWMKEEDEYLSRDNPEDYADLILSGEYHSGHTDEVKVLKSKIQFEKLRS
jgi:uridine kinase